MSAIACHCGNCKSWTFGRTDNEDWQCSAPEIEIVAVIFKSVDEMKRHPLLSKEKAMDIERDELLALRAACMKGRSIASCCPGGVGQRVRSRIQEFHDL